jgi:hypothetical protein
MSDFETPEALLTHAGHLSDLTADRFIHDEFDGDEARELDRHLLDCADCRNLIEEMRAFDAQLVGKFGPPGIETKEATPTPPAKVLSFPTRRAIGSVMAIAAAAALVFFVVQPQDGGVIPTPDRVLIKGNPLTWEVQVEDGDTVKPVEPGATVHPGNRVGFKVRTRNDGYLAIIGIDDDGASYTAYPQGGKTEAAAWSKSEALVPLEAAMRFDAGQSRERLVAVFCLDPFALKPVIGALEQAKPFSGSGPMRILKTGCAQRDILLIKQPKTAP